MARPLRDEADPMREYDDEDKIRLYAPVLQRVIILAAVVIAVPVMMWTITTFIRSYVARPQVPTFQHLTLSEGSQGPSPASPLAANPPPPPQASQPAPTPPLAEIAPTAGSSPTPPADTGSSVAVPAGSSPSPLSVPTVAGAIKNPAQAAVPAQPPPIASPDASGLPTVAQPAGLAARLATNGSGTSAAAPPPVAASPSMGAKQPPDRVTDTGLTDALPPPEPIKGRIPLPPRRPAAIALAVTEDATPPAPVNDAASAATASTETAPTDTLPPPQPIKGRVPLPRRRPAIALAATATVAPAAPIGRAVPIPKLRPVQAPPDATPAPASAPYGYHPGLDSR
jgi:hypothetical protein